LQVLISLSIATSTSLIVFSIINGIYFIVWSSGFFILMQLLFLTEVSFMFGSSCREFCEVFWAE
jgi:hypothetical protein